jgi:hypothetical protein
MIEKCNNQVKCNKKRKKRTHWHSEMRFKEEKISISGCGQERPL